MTERGFIWAEYQTDSGQVFALRVDRDYFAESPRGWISQAASPTPGLPRQSLPRTVVGLDEVGSRRRAIVASTSADLWTGAATTFVVQGSDQVDHVCTVIERLAERLVGPPIS